MRASGRYGLLGIGLGVGLAAWVMLPQVRADNAGVQVMGYAEAMFVLSLPTSVATWLGWLIPASTLFGAGDGAVPRWVAYSWMALTPPLNWGLVGWLLGRWQDRRATARVTAARFGDEK